MIVILRGVAVVQLGIVYFSKIVYHSLIPDTLFMMQLLKFLLDTLPPVLFFISYKMGGILTATSVLLVTSIVCMTIRFAVFKHVPVGMLVGLGILCLFGSMTVYFNDPIFIKIKPTIVYSLLATALLGSVLLKKDLIKRIFGEALPISSGDSKKLSLFLVCVCVLCAVLNEIMWRNFPEATWVNFKIFALPAINCVAMGTAYFLFIHKTLTDN